MSGLYSKGIDAQMCTSYSIIYVHDCIGYLIRKSLIWFSNILYENKTFTYTAKVYMTT